MGNANIEAMMRESSSKPGFLPQERNWIVWWLPVAAGILAAIFYAQFWLPHDDSWYLIATRKFLEGQRLYVDIIEINPPLNFYLTAPALFLGDAIGSSDTVAYVVQTCLLAGLSCVWIARLLHGSKLDATERWIFLAAAIVGVFLLPIRDFAQREHLLLIFALPYFFVAILGEETIDISPREKFALGLVATLGIALKPYFLLLPAAIVLVGPWRHLLNRVFSTANLGLAAGLLSYALFVVLVHPEYFSDILIVATKVYYAFGKTAGAILARPELAAAVLLVILLCLKGEAIGSIGWRLTAAVMAGLAIYLFQFKGWNYQLMPLSFFLPLAAIWIAWRKEIFARRDKLGIGLVILSLTFTLGYQLSWGPYDAKNVGKFSQFVDQPDRRVLVFSTNVSAAFPFVNAVEGTWSSRYPAQWIIPGAFRKLATGECGRDAECAEFERILVDARTANAKDFARFQPEIVFVDVRKIKDYFGGLTFDYIDFMKADPAFAQAWGKCRQIGTISDPAYSVWRCE